MSKKRGHGEGSVFKVARRSDLWAGQVSLQGRRVTKYFRTQREAHDWLHLMRSQIQAGLSLAGAQTTLAEYMDQWLGSIRGAVRPQTLQQYTQIAHHQLAPALGRIKLKDLRPDQIQAPYNEKLDQGKSRRTVIITHAVLHRALKQALMQGIVARNPADAVSRPKFRRKEMKPMTDTQVRTLLLAAKGTRYEGLFWLAVATGLRQGELLGLRSSDIDMRTR